MSLRQEIQGYLDDIPESKLLALKPLLFALTDDTTVVETDLTDEEYAIIAGGMARYHANPTSYIALDDIL